MKIGWALGAAVGVFLVANAPMNSGASGYQGEARIDSGAVVVDIGDNYFSPKTISVPAGVKVKWNNVGRSTHNVTPDSGKSFGASLLAGESYTVAFSTPGTYAYYCTLHGAPGIAQYGTVVARAASEIAKATIKTKSVSPNRTVVSVGEYLEWSNKTKTRQRVSFTPAAQSADSDLAVRTTALAAGESSKVRFTDAGTYKYQVKSVGTKSRTNTGVVVVTAID